jgi:hypothetical protein
MWIKGKRAIVNKTEHYDVDFIKIKSPLETLDWIGQIAEKTWTTDESLGQFVRLLNEARPFQAGIELYRGIVAERINDVAIELSNSIVSDDL